MKSQGWSWGIPELDDLIGPLTPGRLYIVGARPSNGKTAFAMHLTTRILEAVMNRQVDADRQPWKILAWFTERSREVALKSLAALKLGYDEDAVLRGAWGLLPDVAEQKVGDQVAVLRDFFPAFVAQENMGPTIADLRDGVERFSDPNDPDYRDVPEIVVLDYLQMIHPENGQTHIEAMREAMQYFRQLAGQGMTVIVGSQLKRRGDGVFDKYRPPHLEDFYGGGLIEATAEVALGLFRPLQKMSHNDVREVREGRETLQRWVQPGVMAIKCLKHTYLGPAADGIVRARIERNRRIVPYNRSYPPLDAGDAWEPDEERLPF